MMELIMNGKYSDICVIFNGEKIYSHIELLKNVSEYFAIIRKEQFKEKNIIEITMKQFNGESTNPELFKIWIKKIYMGTFDSQYFKNKSLVDIIEFLKMMDYFQYNAVKQLNLKELIETKIKNSTQINDLYSDIFEICNNEYNITFSGGKTKKTAPDQFLSDKIIGPCYECDDKLTFEYTKYLMVMFKTNNKLKMNIIGISNIKEEDIEKYDKEYHQYINYCMATRYYHKFK